jgi:hypothetical protein
LHAAFDSRLRRTETKSDLTRLQENSSIDHDYTARCAMALSTMIFEILSRST